MIIAANQTIKAKEKYARLGFLNTGNLKTKKAEGLNWKTITIICLRWVVAVLISKKEQPEVPGDSASKHRISAAAVYVCPVWRGREQLPLATQHQRKPFSLQRYSWVSLQQGLCWKSFFNIWFLSKGALGEHLTADWERQKLIWSEPVTIQRSTT